MIVYRLGKKQHSLDLSGEGARLFGGRWNNPGTSCLYTAQSRALALLEYSVNININDIPKLLCFTVIEIPDNNFEELKVESLPDNWNSVPAPSSTKIYGTDLLTNEISLAFKIPSTIIQKEFNYILNTNHSDSNKFRILAIENFVYDVRIKNETL